MKTHAHARPHPRPRPWYREPWPWILMAGPAIVVVAGIATGVIAFAGADGLVLDDYYKQGLGINRTIERDAAARRLGVEGELAIDGAHARARLAAAKPLPDRLRLLFAHPTRAGADRVVFLARGAGGEYAAPLAALAPGRWRVIIEADDWRLSALVDTRLAGPYRLGGDAS